MKKQYSFLTEASSFQQLGQWLYQVTGNKKSAFELLGTISKVLNRQGWTLANIKGGTDTMRIVRKAAMEAKAKGLNKEAAFLEKALKNFSQKSEKLVQDSTRKMGEATAQMATAGQRAVLENPAAAKSSKPILRAINAAESEIERSGEKYNKAAGRMILGKGKLNSDAEQLLSSRPVLKGRLNAQTAGSIEDKLLQQIENSNDPHEIQMLTAQLKRIGSKYKVNDTARGLTQKTSDLDRRVGDAIDFARAEKERAAPIISQNLDTARNQFDSVRGIEMMEPSFLDKVRAWKNKVAGLFRGNK